MKLPRSPFVLVAAVVVLAACDRRPKVVKEAIARYRPIVEHLADEMHTRCATARPMDQPLAGNALANDPHVLEATVLCRTVNAPLPVQYRPLRAEQTPVGRNASVYGLDTPALPRGSPSDVDSAMYPSMISTNDHAVDICIVRGRNVDTIGFTEVCVAFAM